MTTGVRLVADERLRQIEEEGWTAEHDASHTGNELTRAAVCYVLAAQTQVLQEGERMPLEPPSMWPWDREYWKPTPDPVRNLVKAAALLVAEIDRLQGGGAVTVG